MTVHLPPVQSNGVVTHSDMLRGVSRTFALSIEQLPRSIRDAVAISYLLFRVSDCVEDPPDLEPQRKADLLRMWAGSVHDEIPVSRFVAEIADLDDSDPEVYVAQHAGAVLQWLNALPDGLSTTIAEHVTETSRGMARWQEHGPYVADESELDDYMFEVAGRVGYLVTSVFAWYSPQIRARQDRLMPLARELGLALQTVNIIRGLRTDYDRGWVFVPQSYYEPMGLTRDALFAPSNAESAMQVVRRLVDKADRHLQRGADFVMVLPRRQHRLRLACAWPLFFAVRTLAVCRDNRQVLSSEAKIGRETVKRIVRDTTLFGWSNHWLAHYYRRLSRKPAPSTEATAG
jgi:farnesyl-diphosphate farnesyltransferase